MAERPTRPSRIVSLYSALTARASALASRRVTRARNDGLSDTEPREIERRGRSMAERPPGLLLWVHAKTAEDARALTWIVPRMSKAMGETVHLLVTTSRAEDASLVSDLGGVHQLAPFDTKSAVVAFLDHWRPDAGVIVEGDYRAALLTEAAKRGLGMVSINSVVRQDAAPFRIQESLVETCVPFFAMIHEIDGSVSQALGPELCDAHEVVRGERILESCVVPEANDSDRAALSALLSTRPIWLASEITMGEVGPVLRAHQGVSKHTHRALLIASTDDPKVAETIVTQAQGNGWAVARRSLGEEPEEHVQVFVADTSGEEGLWYRLASVSFLGGSLAAPGGGISPFPAAALGSVVLHGPHVSDNAHRYDRLGAAEAARLVLTGEGLGSEVRTFLQPDVAARTAQAAWNELSLGAREADRALAAISEILENAEGV